MENKNENLDETKVFNTIDSDDSDTLEIPTFGKKDIEETRVINLNNDTDEDLEAAVILDDSLVRKEAEMEDEDILVDNSQENLRAAEAELDEIFQQQNGNGDGNMAKKKKRSKLVAYNTFLLISSFLFVIGFISATAIWMKLTKDTPDLDIESLANISGAVLYDKNGDEFFDLSIFSGEEGESYDDVVFNDMGQNIVDAFVSIEDSRFFKHKGFDVPRFTKAILENISAGGFAQGGSTLDMQLLKFAQLNPGKSYERKAQEIKLALQLDKELSKDKIFEYYVNKINYGAGNTRGLESAAQYYFDKSASELDISEAALLAGVVNRPNDYSPLKNLKKAYDRRNTVIDLMAYHGYIDKEEAALAKSIKIENQLSEANTSGSSVTDNPYIDYVNAVIDEVKDVLDIDIIATPMNVYTNMDPDIQNDISRIQEEETFRYPDATMQSGIVIGDNETGKVIGIGAGRNSKDKLGILGFNRATDMYQQPGSVTKAILPYALAFEHLGWATSHVVEDKPVNYAGTNKYISNSVGRYYGQIELKDALGISLNTPPYLTLSEVESKIGRNKVAQYLIESLNFSKVTPENYNTQYAIGGSTFQISPMELFAAQAVMMNGGHYIKPQTVAYVEKRDGTIVKDEFEPEKTQVVSEETAYLVSEIEASNVTYHLENRMNILNHKGYPVYAKTGTTDYGDTQTHLGIPVGAGKDQWMYASSKQYTSVVWMGWDKPVAGETSWWTNPKYNSNPLGRINSMLLDSLHKGKANPGRVEKPAGVSEIKHVLATFPYANPIEGMDEKYITTGNINRKFLKLVDLDNTGISIEKLDSFKADLELKGKNKEINIKWSEYPEDGSIKKDTYDISSGPIKATGKILFDKSWIFGPVKYEAVIYVDGVEIDKVTSDKNELTKKITAPNGAEVKVCGYYANSKQEGPETCVTVTNPDLDEVITVGIINSDETLNEFKAKYELKDNQFKVAESKVENTDPTKTGKVAFVRYNGTNISGQKFNEKDLKSMQFEVFLYTEVAPVTPPEDNGDTGRVNNNNWFKFIRNFLSL